MDPSLWRGPTRQSRHATDFRHELPSGDVLSKRAFAPIKSGVSKPSVNQSYTSASIGRTSAARPCAMRSCPSFTSARSSSMRASWRRAISTAYRIAFSAVHSGLSQSFAGDRAPAPLGSTSAASVIISRSGCAGSMGGPSVSATAWRRGSRGSRMSAAMPGLSLLSASWSAVWWLGGLCYSLDQLLSLCHAAGRDPIHRRCFPQVFPSWGRYNDARADLGSVSSLL